MIVVEQAQEIPNTNASPDETQDEQSKTIAPPNVEISSVYTLCNYLGLFHYFIKIDF